MEDISIGKGYFFSLILEKGIAGSWLYLSGCVVCRADSKSRMKMQGPLRWHDWHDEHDWRGRTSWLTPSTKPAEAYRTRPLSPNAMIRCLIELQPWKSRLHRRSRFNREIGKIGSCRGLNEEYIPECPPPYFPQAPEAHLLKQPSKIQ